MSFTIAYELFMRVRVTDQGTGEELDAFSFKPTPDCDLALANYQILFKNRTAGFDLYFKTNPSVPDELLGEIKSRTEFSFGMYLKEKSFFAIYQPGANAMGKKKMYLDNLTPSGNIQASGNQRLMSGTSVQVVDLFPLKPKVYNEVTDKGGSPTPNEWVVKEHFSGNTVGDPFPISSDPFVDLAYAKIDLSKAPNGLYALEANPSTLPDSSVYVDDHLGGQGAVGIVNLYWAAAQTTVPVGGQLYFIRFAKI